MKPYEFWNSTYREINLYIQSNLSYNMDMFRQEIRLQEAVSNKLIMADSMSNKKPKIIQLEKVFSNLFPQRQQKQQSPKEVAKRMREIMKTQK